MSEKQLVYSYSTPEIFTDRLIIFTPTVAQITTICLNTAKTLHYFHALFQTQAKLCMEHCKEVIRIR